MAWAHLINPHINLRPAAHGLLASLVLLREQVILAMTRAVLLLQTYPPPQPEIIWVSAYPLSKVCIYVLYAGYNF